MVYGVYFKVIRSFLKPSIYEGRVLHFELDRVTRNEDNPESPLKLYLFLLLSISPPIFIRSISPYFENLLLPESQF